MGYGDAVDVGWREALRPHCSDSRRRRAARMARPEENRRRRCDPARFQGDRRRGRRRAAPRPSGVLRRTAAGRTPGLDVGTTIQPIYGHPEGARLGYNPKKPGRPSHCCHAYSMASTRLVLDVEVNSGDEHTSKHNVAQVCGLSLIACRDLWPKLLRGDSGVGHEGVMGRRPRGSVALSHDDFSGVAQLSFAEIGEATGLYEYQVVVTSLDRAGRSLRPALSRSRRWRKQLRRDEEPMGLGRLHDARLGATPAGGPPECAGL